MGFNNAVQIVPVKMFKPSESAIEKVRSAEIRFAALFDFTIILMETKRVAATVLAPPAMYQAQVRGFNMLADISALGLPFQATGVATTRKFQC